MPNTERVTVTLPSQMLERMDLLERNRSRFVLEAVKRELERRRREDLTRSLRNPHPETAELAEHGFADWMAGLPPEDDGLLDPVAGKTVRWIEDRGWKEGEG